MIARLMAYDPMGVTPLGVLRYEDLRFSVEVGGGGGCTFQAQAADLASLNAWDSVVALEFETGPGVWSEVARYALRPPYPRPRTGKPAVQCKGTSLLEAWAGETVLFPEFAEGAIPRGAGTERAIGWMSGTYNPAADPFEAWDKVKLSPRGDVFPQDWPTESGADWLSVESPGAGGARKLHRSPDFTIPEGDPALVKMWFSSDESADLYVAGEPVISTSSVETGYEYFSTAYLLLAPGTYSVAVSTFTAAQKGGDGTDPIVMALGEIGPDGGVSSWLMVSSVAWFACRREDEPPNNEPPGPTPGDVVATLQDEAADRGASGWANVTRDFNATTDSYGQPWGGAVVVERMHRVAMDDMWTVWQAFGETGECDTWLEGLVLRCAPAQGTTPGVTLTTATVPTMNDTVPATAGSYCFGFAIDGWHQGGQGGMRREYGLELGTAIHRAVADRIIVESLSNDGRWDGSVSLAPSAPRPLVDFGPGDTIGLTYPDAPASVRVLSIGGRAIVGGMEFDLEVTTP